MNPAHYHLILNHFPIIIPIIALLVLIGGYLVRSEVVKRTALCLFILGAFFTIPAFFTGEGAEEVVEHLQGVNEAIIEKHEEVAKIFVVFSYILGILASIALWANWKQKKFANMLSVLVGILCALTLFWAKQVGTTGGEIRHTEIRTVPSHTNKELNPPRGKDDD